MENQVIFKCDVCGRFVSYSDIASGKAVHFMVTPSSAYTWEEWQTLCVKHSQIAINGTNVSIHAEPPNDASPNSITL